MIIVTGGAGLIGSAVIWRLNELGEDRILAVDHLGTSAKWENLRALRFLDYHEKDDFLELVQADRLPAEIEAIIHLGACSDTTNTDASYLARNNFAYSRTVAEFAARRGVRFIYASSAATYGDGSQGFCDDETLLPRLRPLNMYGYSKQMFDLWMQRQGLLETAVGLKYSNVFGPNEAHKAHMRSVVRRAFEQIDDTGEVRLFRSCREDFADGEQARDFLYVKDAADMTLHFLDNPHAAGIFNIGAGLARTWNDLATAVFRALDRPARIVYIDMPEALRTRYQYFTRLDIAKLRAAGFARPLLSLEDAVADYVRGYLVPDRHLGDA